ncbi:MAG: F0F1 ATP synthase subunit gamma [Oscillospiraceae bacterium]|nr:F0F1 ATP synthase subunit gamma [Oscillospiraceae bacterium]
MPTVQYLKKKLRSIRSTQKISKAMKTASTVKYSRINALYAEFSRYEQSCNHIYERCRADYDALFGSAPCNAPEAFIVMAGNKGMCGSFNSELLSFAEDIIKNSESPLVFTCGKQAKAFFEGRKLPYEKSYVFSDVPSYSEAHALMGDIEKYIADGKISAVKIIYPKYSNMMKQTPSLCNLLGSSDEEKSGEDLLFLPDKESVIKGTEDKILSARLYKMVLETALGAQAATLMTMRSAYDTATELVGELEGQINRKRQSQVTADVIETAAEFSQ